VDDAFREARRIGMSWWQSGTKGQIQSFAAQNRVGGPTLDGRPAEAVR
jgi:hypothetical protein